MADRPILFSGPMVRALLAGTKTQTRRMLNPQPPEGADLVGLYAPGLTAVFEVLTQRGPDYAVRLRHMPKDRLYVRETWQGLSFGDYLPTKSKTCDLRFAATDTLGTASKDVRGYPWRPGIHMPRWASRITLTVTDVRVERLQAINAVDALAEGVSSTEHWRPKDVEGKPFEDKWWDDFTFWSEYPQLAYRELWEAINGPGSWEANPWVAAYTFTVELGNIDQLRAAA